MKKIITPILAAILLASCAVCPPGSNPKNVERWERKHKFRAQIKELNKDSCVVARKMAMARKY